MIIVSACLAGVCCRYDGQSKEHPAVVALVRSGRAIAVCPEQLGGLPTPRPAAERQGRRVVTRQGQDVTAEFERGAREGLKLALLAGCKQAVLQPRSPSCGCGQIHDGKFTGKLVPGDGVFAALLKANGIIIKRLTSNSPKASKHLSA